MDDRKTTETKRVADNLDKIKLAQWVGYFLEANKKYECKDTYWYIVQTGEIPQSGEIK